MTQKNPVIQLSNYTPLDFEIESVNLTFKLHPTATRVTSKLIFTANPAGNSDRTLRLDGEALKLISASIDGETLDLTPDAEGLTLPADRIQKDRFTWECEVEIDPENNTSLDGLYMSNGMYCTQCEAEGFRKITFYPDRPDVMTTFTVRIESNQPVMLSNGNPTLGEDFAEWHDPWPKPAYLFALVAGDLVAHSDHFTTMSGRHVDLNIYVREGDQDKCAYAMHALKRSMKWDEEQYGREYDLDLFNIVAVNDFNMAAMENKGLNVFNSTLVLASPETATDVNYTSIERVIAHEYFHNWTGNRITCRDWFQLCLKEGLTVYRDQHFMGDMRDPSVKRIEDVITLRGRQFAEDAGPLAHPPRPNQYEEINNFYTSTVYEKGAEIVGMLRRLVGPIEYRKSLDLYFDRHDGQACTIEDWIKVFEDTTGRDLSQFKLWYTSAGTPHVKVAEDWTDGVYTLTLTQETPATPNEDIKSPRLVPVAVGLLYPDGSEAVPTKMLELIEPMQNFTFEDLREKPILSILRDFSAPVILEHDISNDTRAFLLAHDTDPFNKWEAGRAYALDILERLVSGANDVDDTFLSATRTMALDDSLDPAFRALALGLPGEESIAANIFAKGGTPDPIAIHNAREHLNKAIATYMADDLPELYAAMEVTGPFSADAKSAGKRALRGQALNLLTSLEINTAKTQFATAANMTEQLSALSRLVAAGDAEPELEAFYQQWQNDYLVVNKWLSVQAVATPAKDAVETVKRLTKHSTFEWKNPNRFRSLFGAFAAGNPAGFHDTSGAGYELFADWMIKLDQHNPQITARLCTVLESWRRYSPVRQAQMKAALERIANAKGLSKNTTEIVGKILGS